MNFCTELWGFNIHVSISLAKRCEKLSKKIPKIAVEKSKDQQIETQITSEPRNFFTFRKKR